MKKWIALVLVVIAFTAVARAAIDSGEAMEYYPYYGDYPRTLLFKGLAMTKSGDTYPALFLATETGADYDAIWDEDSDAKFLFILNGEVHEMGLKDVEYVDGGMTAKFNGDGELVLLIRYQNYYNQVSVSGVYNGKYLLNLGLANNEPIYRLMDGYAESAPVNTDGWIQGVAEKIAPAVGSSARVLPEESAVEDLW